MDIYKTVTNTINSNRMIRPGMHVIAAVSGGADSICLLYVLKELAPRLGITLEAFHLHHGLRAEEADGDAEYVKEICRQWQIPLSVRYENVRKYGEEHKLSLEEAGRILRYQALEERKKAAEEAENGKTAVAAVAHHMGDSAETILHNLFRGSGLKGLRGIPAARDWVIRPLIALSRQEIVDFLMQEGVAWREDSTNRDNDYTRNKIRNSLLPMIKEEINQEAEAHIIQAGRLIGMADDFFEKTAEGLWEEWGERGREESCSFPVSVMAEQEAIVRFYLIRYMTALAGKTVKDLAFSHVQSVEQLLRGETGKKVDLPGKMEARREYGKLYVEKKKNFNKDGKLFPTSCINENVREKMEFKIFSYKKGGEIPKNQYTKWFDYDKMKNVLCLRFRQPGDYITLAGGGKKSIKSFMIDEKIPRGERGGIPLLADGKHIVWIVGYRISEYYKITEDTKTALEARFDGGGENGRKNTGLVE